MIMDHPSAHNIFRITGPELMLKLNPKRTTTISKNTSHRPRVQRKRESWLLVRPRLSQKKALIPAVDMNTGAQMCVIQRVRKSVAVVRERSSGENDIAPTWKKSRT